MLLRIDPNDPRPLHEQVAGALRRAIAEGDCPDQLPPARELAEGLDVNANTVLRALRDLRDEGLLEFRRGRGIRVVSGANDRGAFIASVRALIDEGGRRGYSRADLIGLIEEIP